MLSLHPHLNPAVVREADLFTDGLVTDQILRSVAEMRSLPLLIERTPCAGPDALTLAERELAAATHAHRGAAECFAGACRRLGEANARFHPPLRAGGPRAPISPETRRREQSQAMSWLNSRRALLRKAERRLAAAQAAIAALGN
ncbi:hypothetical protein EAH89_26140 [Roseomonas nepalensis]|uniref:Uncharacterized protein n=1 Tax=Muricoccus nepalensis TaxID=1854500 RepID=A0A502F8H3_9PROT|nr:hypothetical protein [Roseomonas nepalensis]TPG45685.1 hypothetical protein EAH89_26140 [Roseomonas nepalensis]